MIVCYVDPNPSPNSNFGNEILMKLKNLILCRIVSLTDPSFATFVADSVASYMLFCSLIVSLVNHNTESEVSYVTRSCL